MCAAVDRLLVMLLDSSTISRMDLKHLFFVYLHWNLNLQVLKRKEFDFKCIRMSQAMN